MEEVESHLGLGAGGQVEMEVTNVAEKKTGSMSGGAERRRQKLLWFNKR